MLELRFTAKLNKDYGRIEKQGKKISELERVLELLVNGEALPESIRDHSLGGTNQGRRERHIEPDWLLIYRIEEGEPILAVTRTGSHSELLGL